MPVTDISAIDTALLNMLTADSALQALCPDGVFWDIGAQGSDAFVVISRSDGEHENALDGGDGWERFTYTIKAVLNTGSAAAANDAALRIHELLHHGTVDVSAGNYTLMLIERIFPIRFQEVDASNAAIRWQHHGGQYTVMVCPNSEGGS